MKISPDGSASFSTGSDVDSLSERTSQDSIDSGVQRAPSNETSFQEQMLPKTDQITVIKLSADRAGKEVAGLVSLCLFFGVVSTVHSFQKNVFLEKGGWVYHRFGRQMASGDPEELKQSVITLEQDESQLLVKLSNIQKECAQLKSELSDVKKDCDSSIAALKVEVVSSSAQGPMVQPAKQYVWESSRDVSVNGPRNVELLECPPMTSWVHKWSVLDIRV